MPGVGGDTAGVIVPGVVPRRGRGVPGEGERRG